MGEVFDNERTKSIRADAAVRLCHASYTKVPEGQDIVKCPNDKRPGHNTTAGLPLSVGRKTVH